MEVFWTFWRSIRAGLLLLLLLLFGGQKGHLVCKHQSLRFSLGQRAQAGVTPNIRPVKQQLKIVVVVVVLAK